jgi:hypothetical protein
VRETIQVQFVLEISLIKDFILHISDVLNGMF